MRYALCMRTTLTIDADVLRAARDIAARQNSTIGQVISELARQSLTGGSTAQGESASEFHGIRPLPRRGVVVSNDVVNAIREEEAV